MHFTVKGCHLCNILYLDSKSVKFLLCMLLLCVWYLFIYIFFNRSFAAFKQLISFYYIPFWCMFFNQLSNLCSSWIFWKNILSCDCRKLVLHIEERICICKLPLYWKKWLDQTWLYLFLTSWVNCPRTLCMWMGWQARMTKKPHVWENYALFSRELMGIQIWILLEEHNLGKCSGFISTG